jgi:hypothetical protein
MSVCCSFTCPFGTNKIAFEYSSDDASETKHKKKKKKKNQFWIA